MGPYASMGMCCRRFIQYVRETDLMVSSDVERMFQADQAFRRLGMNWVLVSDGATVL